jgi:hypothetical protein
LDLLTQVFNGSDPRASSGELPISYLSYLGYGLVRYRNKRREGFALCEQAVKLEFYQVDSWFNLARAAALLGERRKAVNAVERALKLDPQHAPSLELRAEMGARRIPVFGFLSRDHFLNRWFGKIRHDLSPAPKPRA